MHACACMCMYDSVGERKAVCIIHGRKNDTPDADGVRDNIINLSTLHLFNSQWNNELHIFLLAVHYIYSCCWIDTIVSCGRGGQDNVITLLVDF